jgi:hypothetical protein
MGSAMWTKNLPPRELVETRALKLPIFLLQLLMPVRSEHVLNVLNGWNELNGPILSMLPAHPTVDVDLVAFVLRDVEGVSIGIEAAVFGPSSKPARWI